MGDRCYIQVQCLKKDVERFAEFEMRDEDESKGVVMLVEEEANWAHDCPNDWPEDIPYVGYHGEGDNYSSAVFACDGKKLVYVETLAGEPAVRVTGSGVSKQQVNEARAYYRVRERAERLLGLKKRGKHG